MWLFNNLRLAFPCRKRFPSDGTATARAGMLCPRARHLFPASEYSAKFSERFRANNLRRRDLRSSVTEFSSLNRSIPANGGDVNYFIIGWAISLALSLSLFVTIFLSEKYTLMREGEKGKGVAPICTRCFDILDVWKKTFDNCSPTYY